MPSTVVSKDGTRIAYDKMGHGQVVILVLGALKFKEIRGQAGQATFVPVHGRQL